MKYEVGEKVITKLGKGMIIDFKIEPYDGNCYLIQLENSLQIWRKENYIEKTVPQNLLDEITEIIKKYI